MKVTYDSKHDLLYLQFDDTARRVRNEDVSDSIVLEIDEQGRVSGLEILGASQTVNLSRLLPVEYEPAG
jgi:uncharacterized protein YuzE